MNSLFGAVVASGPHTCGLLSPQTQTHTHQRMGTHTSLHPRLQLRVWGRVLSQDEVKRNMWRERPDTEEGLAALYIFDAEGIKDAAGNTASTASGPQAGEALSAVDRTCEPAGVRAFSARGRGAAAGADCRLCSGPTAWLLQATACSISGTRPSHPTLPTHPLPLQPQPTPTTSSCAPTRPSGSTRTRR